MQTLQLKQVITHHLGPIDLNISDCEIVGLSGDSGAGKSLLLRTIADLDPHHGDIILNGISQQEMPPQQWRHQVAYLAAESQWWSDTVADHFITGDHALLNTLLQQIGFTSEALQWSVHHLSTGEKQRLGIIRQLIRQPAVLLLDEPTASLDRENCNRVEQLLVNYCRQQHAALLWVSHDSVQLQRVCDRQYRIINGKLEADAT